MRWTLESGRTIVDAGNHVARVIARPLNDGSNGLALAPWEVDSLAHHVVNALNVASPEAAKALTAPMVDWRAAVDHLSPNAAQDLSKELDAIIERAARLRAYVEMRQTGNTLRDDLHTAGVKASNALAQKVRKVLGYSQHKVDVTF